jgi:competence protein ComEC
MMGRLIAIFFVAGVSFTHTLGELPPLKQSVCLLLFVGLGRFAVVKFSRAVLGELRSVIINVSKPALSLGGAFALGIVWTTWLAQQRLQDQLAPELENHVSKLNVRVVSMPQDDGLSQRFIGQVESAAQAGIPERIQVSWLLGQQAPDLVGLKPGQLWRMALVLKRPHGLLNPHGFDYEGMMFQKNIRALGKVRGTPKLIEDDPLFSPLVLIARLRQHIRQQMRLSLGDSRYGAVLIALAIGDQDSVKAYDWKIFNLSGITHLVSISGSHVTLMAAIGASFVVWLAKRISWRGRSVCEAIAAKRFGALSAMLFAWAYCLLAGWGVPAQRTFFMLSVVACSLLLRAPLSGSRVLCLAAAVVCLLDPWSTMAVGFWLSFGAVAVLFYLAQSQSSSLTVTGWRKYSNMFFAACFLQVMITLALWPMLSFLFHQASLSSLFANALAIPVVTFVVTPIALIASVLALIPWTHTLCFGLLKLGHLVFEYLMVPVEQLALIPWASFDFAAVPLWVLGLSLLGLAWALAPSGVPLRWLGWLLCLPGLLWVPVRPTAGYWAMQVVDVGQGSALLLQTQQHNLLFDTGLRIGESNSAERVLQPMMRALNITKLDYLIVSHADNDHAGGLPYILKTMPVKNLITSFEVQALLEQTPVRPASLPCHAGQRWELDGVNFSFLNPPQQEAGTEQRVAVKKIKKNALSCVLLVQGREHSALLPGDIGAAQEKVLIQKTILASATASAQNTSQATQPSRDMLSVAESASSRDIRVEVAIVPHHGSSTSSSEQYIQWLQARHAIAQVGALNRFGHPDPDVQTRWKLSGAQFWRTDQHGALSIVSAPEKLLVTAERKVKARYWHAQ